MRQKLVSCCLALVLLLTLSACGTEPVVTPLPMPSPTETEPLLPVPDETEPLPSAPVETEEAGTPEPSPEFLTTPELEDTPQPKHKIVIDPGHQNRADLNREPIGPGASETKYRVTGGTYGKTSGLCEYELNLTVSLLLREELEARGYEVLLTRSEHDVSLSNAERATIANEAEADVFLRIHANGSEDPTVQGAMTICMTPNNPYNAWLYEESRALSDCVLEGFVAATGAKAQSVWETDTMSGINWSLVPVTILEMGYMSNAEEDLRMATETYQKSMAYGIANGIDAYFQTKEDETAQLRAEIEAELARCGGEWDVWAEALPGGKAVHVTQNVVPGSSMVAASLIKLFIMGTVFSRIAEGTLDAAAVDSLLRSMITVSDNASANRLTTMLGNGDAATGRRAVEDWAAANGCLGVRYERLMLEENGLQNYVRAEDCATILRSIWAGACVSPEASAKMLDLLCAQEVNDRIPQGLPAGTRCAHKTGNLYGLCVADVGVVFAPDGAFLLCAICNHPSNDANAATSIARLAKLVFSAFSI